MKESPIVSIIVPVYNTEKYVEECILSLINQTCTDIEILLIDDGSQDDSLKICLEFVSKDSRVQVFHQENGGVTSARKHGVMLAKGEWIFFVDSDDTIPLNAVEVLLAANKKYDSDFFFGFFSSQKRKGERVIPLETWREYCISGEYVMPGPVARLIRRNLFSDWCFDIPRSIVKGEDMLMNIRLAFNMKKNPVAIFEKVYNYRSNPDSCVHTFIQNADYEYSYHKQRLASIPVRYQSRYLCASVHKRLLMLNEMYMNAPLDADWYKSNFYNQLFDDVKCCQYKLTFIERLKFCGNVPQNRSFVWLIVKFDRNMYNISCGMKIFVKRILSIE